MCRTSCVTRILALYISIAVSFRQKYIIFGAYIVHTSESREIKSEEFFDDNKSFFTPVTLNPSFDNDVKQFIGITEEEEFFKKENDIFDKMREDEAFFFKKEQNEKSGKRENKETDVVSQHSRVCNCEGVYCGCCSAIRVLGKERFRGCVQIEYVPGDFAMFMTLSINGHTVITRVLSGRNPLPFCAKTPYVPLVSFCIRLYDIHHNPHGVSLCVRLEATSMRQILFSISFDCIKIDNNKISFMMPPNATTFGVVGLHLGDTDPYLSYQDWTKLHWPLPDVLPTTTQPHPLAHQHHFLWLNWK